MFFNVRVRAGAWLLAAVVFPLTSGTHSFANSEQIVTVDVSRTLGSISPFIYGFGGGAAEVRGEQETWVLQPPAIRWGGNASERYNWKLDAANANHDWFFRNFKYPGKNNLEQFIAENSKNKATSVILLPLLGYVAKDTVSAAFPVSKFGPQEAADGDAGNGKTKSGSLISGIPELTSVPAGPEFIAKWVERLKILMPVGPRHYILGNEPMLWFSSHRDIHPYPTTYDEVRDKFIAMALAVRKVDPTAVIYGPSLWSLLAMERSADDLPRRENFFQRDRDRKKHGGKPFLEWFLAELKAREKKEGVSLLDVLTVHYYPQVEGVGEFGVATPNIRNLRIENVRSLWDEDYIDPSWLKEKISLIPRLKKLAAAYKPTLKIALGEYNFRGENDPSGGVAQAEALGVFGLHKLDAAFYWHIPPLRSAPWFAFKAFRNFDERGGSFGSTSVKNNWNVQKQSSIFSSVREDGTLTIMIINKDFSKETKFKIEMPWEDRAEKKQRIISGISGTATVYETRWERTALPTLSSRKIKVRSTHAQMSKPNVKGNKSQPAHSTLSLTSPPSSILMIEIPRI